MKNIHWLGTTYAVIKDYPADIKREIGYNLDKIQRGLEPTDWKPMVSIGAGVKEIRVHAQNEYRVLYVAKYQEAVYILNSFIKKTAQTPKKEIEITKKRYQEMLNTRRSL